MEVEFPASVYINDVAVAVMQSQLSFFFDIADGTVDKRDRLYTNNGRNLTLEKRFFFN